MSQTNTPPRIWLIGSLVHWLIREFPMKLAFTISTQPTRFQAITFDPNFEENAAYFAQLGYDGIELGVREPHKLDVARMRAILAQHRLVVPAIGTGQVFLEEQLSFTDPDASVRERALARLRTHLDLATQFDPTPVVIIGLIRGGKVPSQVAREVAYAWMVDAIRTLAQEARTRGVRLAIEPINRYETEWVNTVADALALIEDIGLDNLGILFDTFHANIEEPRIEESLRACGARLFHVHLADSNRWYPGAGHTDFACIFATLRAMNYAGWVSAEILPKPDVKRAAAETYKTLKPLLGT
ncbi:MAG: 5-keto-L-gluconate epimerase [Anaerolineae bacterium]|nr:5-keto-L-gluconate epimerase [Anaerolineae bacterium]